MKNKSLFIFLLGFLGSQFAFGQFIGGSADGHDQSFAESAINIYAGASEDGYDLAEFNNSINIYKGGSEDGHTTSGFDNSISIFVGGAKDGYASSSKFLSFVWTGNVDEAWDVAGNWLNGVIPDINSRVVIPSGATNFPAINTGLMSIGQNPNSGIYLCKQINILRGAEMTLTFKAFLENYGDIDIRGTVYILNTAIDAVQNLSGGKIDIRSGGRLEF